MLKRSAEKMGIFTKDLSETKVGRVVFSVLIPLSLIAWGVHVLFSGSINLRGTEFTDEVALFYGAGITALGFSSIFSPSVLELLNGSSGVWQPVRMILGLVIGAILIGVAALKAS